MLVADKEQERRKYIRVNPAMGNPILSNIQLNGREFNKLQVIDISLGGVALKLPELRN